MKKAFAEENLPPDIQKIADRMNVDPSTVPEWRTPELPFDDNCSPAAFSNCIREILKRPFLDYVYGRIPPRCDELVFRKMTEDCAFDGLAIRREIDIICRHNGMEQTFHLLLYIPAKIWKPTAVFLGLNFGGNHSTTFDPGVSFHPFEPYPPLIPESLRWRDRRFLENQRGAQAHRWEFERVLRAGFATATMNYFDIYPDHPHGFAKSIFGHYYISARNIILDTLHSSIVKFFLYSPPKMILHIA